MATVNFIKCKKQCRASMKGTIDYVLQKFKVAVERENLERSHAKTYTEIDEGIRKTLDYDGCIALVSGKDCCPETAYNEFMATKKTYNKANGMLFYHYDQSFKIGENISPKTAHEIALKFAEDNYEGFEVLVATHMDKEHLHSHFIINSVSFENGIKLHQGTDTLKKLRAYSDEVCKSYGLSTLEAYESGRTKTIGSREYRAAVKGESWKFKLMSAIDECMKRSRTKEDFIKNMERLGYSVRWSDTRKAITYTTPNGKACRDFKLHEEKYLKERMENEFRIRTINREEQSGYSAVGTSENRPHVSDYDRAMVADSQATATPVNQDGTAFNRTENVGNKRPNVGLSESDTQYLPKELGENNNTFRGNPDHQQSGDAKPVLTGWERERAELDNAESLDGYNFKPIQTVTTAVIPQDAVVGDILSDAVRLGHNLSKIGEDYSQRPPKERHIKERKRSIGQKKDDHSGDEPEWSQHM